MKITPTPNTKQVRGAYRYHGPEVWAVVREAYLAGESCAALADRFGMSQAAIRRRIWLEGWTKRSVVAARDAALLADVAAQAVRAADVEAQVASEAPMEPLTAARAALDEAVKLIRMGRMSEAAGAARAADVVARAAGRLGGGADPLRPAMRGLPPPAAEDVDDEAAFEAVRRKVLGQGLAPRADEDCP